MLMALCAFRGLRKPDGARLGPGIALALLPWLGVKYIPLALMILAVGLVLSPAGKRLRCALASGAPLAAGLALHAWFTWRVYGSLSPAAIYLGAGPPDGTPAFGANWSAYVAAWPYALATAVGYLIDQKDGLLAYGPHLILAAAGAALLWKACRRELVALTLVATAYLGPYALSQQLGGQGPPVRPLMAVLWVLAPALGLALALPATSRLFRRGARRSAGAVGGPDRRLREPAGAVAPRLSRARLAPDPAVFALRLGLVALVSRSGSNVDEPNWAVTAAWTAGVAVVVVLLWRLGSRSAPEASLGRSKGDAEWAGWNAARQRGRCRRQGYRSVRGAAAVTALGLCGPSW